MFTNMLVYAAVQHKCGGRWSVPVTLREEVSLSPTYADKSLVRLIPQTVICAVREATMSSAEL